jgi:Mpv17 / PMP22 family
MRKLQLLRPLLLSLLLLTSSSCTAFRRDDFCQTAAAARIHVNYYNNLMYRSVGGRGNHCTIHSLKQKQLVPYCRGGGVGGVSATICSNEKDAASFLERHAFMFAVSITTVKAVLADLLTQLVFEKGIKNNIPWNAKRTLVFGAFGLFYQGMVQYVIVNLFWERIFPCNKPRAVVSKICAMNLLSDPLLFMPTFYIFKQVMMTGASSASAAGASVSGGGGAFIATTVKAALLAYKANCFMDWRNSWLVWFPGHAVTYGVMPMHKRIPWMAFLSFFYMCVLSYTRGGA